MYEAQMGGHNLQNMRNTDVVLPSARAIEPGYATFILVLYSSIISSLIFFYYL
jgi:hypothetical protein